MQGAAAGDLFLFGDVRVKALAGCAATSTGAAGDDGACTERGGKEGVKEEGGREGGRGVGGCEQVRDGAEGKMKENGPPRWNTGRG